MKRLLPLVLGLGFAHASQAQESSGAYMGFAIGSFDYKEEDENVAVLTISDKTSAYRILGGYRFTDNFALEGGWGATSDIEHRYNIIHIQADYETLTVRALGILPVSKVGFFGGVGYYDAKLNVSVSVTGFGRSEGERSDSGATLVGGLQWDLQRVSIRGEYEWFDTDSNVEAWDISVGLLFRF